MVSVTDRRVSVNRAPRVRLTIPQGFDARKVLPRHVGDRAEESMLLVSTVVRKTRSGKTDRRGYVRLNRRVLQRTMSERTITPIQNALVAAGVLERDDHRIGEYSTGFRLTASWSARPLRTVPVTDRRLIDRIQRELIALEQLHLARRLPVHDDLDRIQRELLTVGPLADAMVASIADAGVRKRQETLLRQIRSGRHGSRSFTGRWYYSFCGCKRILRPIFQLDGQPLGGFDLRCAQPGLTAVLLGPQLAGFAQCVGAYSTRASSRSDREDWADRSGRLSRWGRDRLSVLAFDYILSVASGVPPCGPDLEFFADLTLHAEFYEHMLDRARASGVDLSDPDMKGRSELAMVKILTLREVLAKEGTYPSDFERVFREDFPTVLRTVRWINSRRSPPDGCGRERAHGKLVRILQRLESAFVLETVCPPLLNRIPVAPLHDCLYTRLSDIALVEQGFEEAFDRCGVRLEIKRDVPCEPSNLN